MSHKYYKSSPPKSNWNGNNNPDPNTDAGIRMLMQDPNSIFYKINTNIIAAVVMINECRKECREFQQIEQQIEEEYRRYEEDKRKREEAGTLNQSINPLLALLEKQLEDLHQQYKALAARMKALEEHIEVLSKQLEELQKELDEEYKHMSRLPDEIYKDFLASGRYQEIVDELGPECKEKGIDIEKVLKRLEEQCENDHIIPDETYYRSNLEKIIFDEYVQNERARTGQDVISDEKLIIFKTEAANLAEKIDQKAKFTDKLKEGIEVISERVKSLENRIQPIEQKISGCRKDMSQCGNEMTACGKNISQCEIKVKEVLTNVESNLFEQRINPTKPDGNAAPSSDDPSNNSRRFGR